MGAPTRESTHTHDDELLDYFAEKLPEQHGQQLEEHLAICDVCTTRARAVYAFHDLWERWTAAAHGRAYQQELVNRALRDAEASSTEWKKRLRQWRIRWRGLGEAALQVVMNLKAGAGEVVARGVDALNRPGSAWMLRPVLQPAFVRGDLVEGQDVAEFTTTAVANNPTARVIVRAAQRSEITIRIDGIERIEDAPLALLIAVDPAREQQPRVAEAVQATGASYFLARFTDVPPGAYMIVVEPLQR